MDAFLTLSRETRLRILGAFATNGFERGIRIVEQLLLIPLLIGAWGAARYGEWITVSAIATFSTAANLGLGQAGCADIILRRAAGDNAGANRSLVTTLCVLVLVVIAGIGALALFVMACDVDALLSLRALGEKEAASAIVLLGASLFCTFLTEPFAGALGAMKGVWLSNLVFVISKSAEIIGIVIVLRFSAAASAVAAVMLAATLLNVSLHILLSWRYVAWLDLRISAFDADVLRRTWRPASGFFFIFVFMYVVSVQVPRLLVYHLLGAAAVAAFAVLVTYTRAARMFASVISRATPVEMSLAFGRGELLQAAQMVRSTTALAVLACILGVVGELLLAPAVVPFWTHGQVAIDWPLLVALAAVAVVGSYYDAKLQAAGALNAIGEGALWYAICLVLALFAAAWLVGFAGLAGMGLALLFAEIGGSIGSTRALRRVLHA